MLLLTPPAPVALSVSPARIALTAPASRTIKLRNAGAEAVVVDVTRRALGESAAFKRWVHVVPPRQGIPAGRSVTFTLRVSRPPAATPGDHSAVVLLTTRSQRNDRVAVRLRVGVRLIVRVPGRLVRRVELGRPRVQRGRIVVSVANRGNVVLPLGRQVSLALLRRGHVVALLRTRAPSVLLPGGRVALRFAYATRLRGSFLVEVRVGRKVRRYRVRL